MAAQDNLARKPIYIPATQPEEELSLRVAAYCRVSSDSDDQLKGFSILFNETRLWGDVKLSPQSLVLFFVTILFNEKSEPWPFFGQVWPIINFSDRCFLSFIPFS